MTTDMPWHLIKHAFERSREKYGSDVDRKEYERQRKEDYMFVIGLTFVLIAITTWLIVFGPRSALFG